MLDVIVDPDGDHEQDLSANEIPTLGPHINYSDIALQLLEDRMLLTALELHCELIESGKEVPKLKEFFSNPGNFESSSRSEVTSTALTRWSSQATLDSLDMARLSEDGAADDRIAVLEFELRKAKETINALRTNLTVAYECEAINQVGNTASVANIAEPIKPHEQRALNFLINEYLLVHGYKLTSNTFADENENQDFEVWDDVGLNIPKPPELTHLYREFLKNSYATSTDCQTLSLQTQHDSEETELLISQLNQLKEVVSELELKNKLLTEDRDKLKDKEAKETAEVSVLPEAMNDSFYATPISDSGSTKDHFIIVDSYSVSNSDNTDVVEDASSLGTSDHLSICGKLKSFEIIENGDTIESSCSGDDWLRVSEQDSMTRIDSRNDILQLLNENCVRQVPLAFQNEIFSKCYVETAPLPGVHLLAEEDLDHEDALSRFVHILAGSLHRIASGISPSNKEDLMLLIVYTIRHHPLARVREKLIQLLLKLKEKPQDEERKVILSGIVWLARNANTSILENEVLTLCWEELNCKHVENRVLVSELCCCVAPYVSTLTRNSLLLSLLQQILLDDKEERVRISAIHSIAFISTFIDDDDKYMQCEELLFTGLQDANGSVIEVTIQLLLPVLAKWAFDIEKLASHLIPRLVHILHAQIESAVHHCKSDQGSPFKRALIWQTRCSWTISALRRVLPYVVMHVASAPFVLQSVHPNLPNALPRSTFSEVCKDLCNPSSFYGGKYSLGQVIRSFDAVVEESTWPEMEWLTGTLIPEFLNISSPADMLIEELTTDITLFFRTLCAGFGRTAVKAKVKNIFLEKLKIIETELANVTAEYPNLFVLPIFILAVLVPLQETEEIQTTLRKFLYTLPLCGCPITALEYCVRELSKINSTQDLLLTVLWEGVVHAREAVRLTVVKLFSLIIPHSSDFTIVNRITPAIVTLSNDSHLLVKTATIPVFGKLIKDVSKKEVSDKCCFQIQTLLMERNLFENHVHIVQLISTLGDIASHVDAVFREDVLLPHLAATAAYAARLTNQTHKQELFRALLDAFSSIIYCSFTTDSVSNTLLPGLRCLESICGDSIAHHEAVASLIKEVETRTYGQESGSSPPVSSVTVNVGMEVKQRMSKIFQTPLSKPGKFWKK